MPTEARFDDLDLREEPALPTREQSQIYSGAPPLQGAPNTTTTQMCCV